MSVVKMQQDITGNAIAGGAMDRAIEKRGLSSTVKAGIAAGVVLIAAILFYIFMPGAGSQSIDASRLTISTVTKGTFEDYLPLRARVTPLLTVYIDSIEGGRVEEVLVEDGATVQKGQLLARLSNAELQLSVLARQTEVTQQVNSMRSQELALAQTRSADERSELDADLALRKAKRQYDREAPLAQRGFVAGKQFGDTSDDLRFQQERMGVVRRTRATNERLQSSQLSQLRAASDSMEGGLALARANLDALNLRAPVSGTLSAFSIQVGQSLGRGERMGQIDSPGRNKLMATVDEYYLGRVQVSQTAAVDWNGKTFRMRVTKIYPTVRNGGFDIDLQFLGEEPAGIQRGQTLQAKLTLGDPAPARLIPAGAFYNDTGGTWVFVVSPDRSQAVKRQVRMGRRNSDFIEILDGLDPGELVLTSPYAGFADKEQLILTTP